MWNTLSRASLEAARQQLQSRREEMLRHHAEELSALENEETELETLKQRINEVVKKFNIGNASVFEPATAGSTEPNEGRIENQNLRAGLSFLITHAQKSKLRELGIRDDEIREMKPDEAHRLLGIAS